MHAVKGEGPVPAVSENEAPKIVSTGKRDDGLFSLRSPGSQPLAQSEFARSAVIASVALQLPDRCRCGRAITLICAGRDRDVAELRCESCGMHLRRVRVAYTTSSPKSSLAACWCGAAIVQRRGADEGIVKTANLHIPIAVVLEIELGDCGATAADELGELFERVRKALVPLLVQYELLTADIRRDAETPLRQYVRLEIGATADALVDALAEQIITKEGER
jgi:hypothetical protein